MQTYRVRKMNTTEPKTREAIFSQQLKIRYKIVLYLFMAGWFLLSVILFIEQPTKVINAQNMNAKETEQIDNE